jgi:hypothetical protein
MHPSHRGLIAAFIALVVGYLILVYAPRGRTGRIVPGQATPYERFFDHGEAFVGFLTLWATTLFEVVAGASPPGQAGTGWLLGLMTIALIGGVLFLRNLQRSAEAHRFRPGDGADVLIGAPRTKAIAIALCVDKMTISALFLVAYFVCFWVIHNRLS